MIWARGWQTGYDVTLMEIFGRVLAGVVKIMMEYTFLLQMEN